MEENYPSHESEMLIRQPSFSLLLVKVAAQCNINCSYCYIYNTGYRNGLENQPKFITEETILNIARQVQLLYSTYNDFVVCLHGGEPLLIGYDRLKFILDTFSENSVKNITIQTNATLITTKILDLLYEYNCSIGISLDGKKEDNDKFRIYRNGKGSFEKTKQGLDLILDHPIKDEGLAGIIAVIDPKTDPIETYNYLTQFKPNHIDFLFKDGYYEQLPNGKATLTSVEYGMWLAKLAKYYCTLDNPIPIKRIDRLISDYIRHKLGGSKLEPFGMITVNPNGDIIKNDLYDIIPKTSSFKRKWNINKDELLHLLMTKEYRDFTYDSIPLGKKCNDCRYLHCCGGGDEIHARWSNINGLKNPSVFCEDYQYFFDTVDQILDEKLLTITS